MKEQSERFVSCPCGERATVKEVPGYWFQVHCKSCDRFIWGFATETDAVVEWIRRKREEKTTREWINYYIQDMEVISGHRAGTILPEWEK